VIDPLNTSLRGSGDEPRFATSFSPRKGCRQGGSTLALSHNARRSPRCCDG
jgi:hypothetical protein